MIVFLPTRKPLSNGFLIRCGAIRLNRPRLASTPGYEPAPTRAPSALLPNQRHAVYCFVLSACFVVKKEPGLGQRVDSAQT
jgi:hypothetical protein